MPPVIPVDNDRQVAKLGVLTLVLLSAGHFFVDLYSGALGVLQPLLVQRFAMTMTDAGILGGVLVCFSSVLQPVYGIVADRLRTRLLSALGPAVAGIFISCIGLAPSYGWVLAMVALGGTGVAMFHPQASSQAVAHIAGNRARAMAAFISAGTLGFALGPLYFSAVSSRLGLNQMFWAMLPGLLITGFLLVTLPAPAAREGHQNAGFDWPALRAVRRPLTILYLLVFIRSIIQVTFGQLIPLYLCRERGYSLAAASTTLSMFLGSGALGGFVGGHLADRFGARRIIVLSMAASAPLLALFFFTSGIIAIGGLLLGGVILLFTLPVNVVMAQELVPSQASTISALMMGFAWGTAGLIFVPLTGRMSDLFSLHHALAALLIFPVFGFFLSLRLPK